MKWLWPLSWYLRIKLLEDENAALRAVTVELAQKLRAQLAAHAVAQAGMTACYVNAIAGLSSSLTNLYPRPKP